MANTNAEIEVVNPVAEQRPETITPARRLNDLKGKKDSTVVEYKGQGGYCTIYRSRGAGKTL
ncbi:hypothetical protein ACFLW4_00220 [Chloroflexota bacterium]